MKKRSHDSAGFSEFYDNLFSMVIITRFLSPFILSASTEKGLEFRIKSFTRSISVASFSLYDLGSI